MFVTFVTSKRAHRLAESGRESAGVLLCVVMRVTVNFTVAEFACKDGSSYPTDNVEPNGNGGRWIDTRLRPLCESLEVIRTAVGKPIHINSGYRSDAYNKKIGGARLSQHVQGRAADIVVASGMSAAEVHALVLKLCLDGKLPHIRGLGRYPTFCHVDVRLTSQLVRWSGSRSEN